MAENRYVKVNANWMDSEWLIVLSAEARLAWVQLLCYVKAYGIGGRVKSKSALVFAKQNFLGEESVEQMLRAAKADGALEITEGEWVLTGWQQHQGDSTGAERQKRHRDRLKSEESNDSNALRNDSNTYEEERRREERKGEDKPPIFDSPPRGSKRGSRPVDVDEVKAYGLEIGLPPDECLDFWEHFENNGWKQSGKTAMKDWKLSCNRWKRTWLKTNPGKKPPPDAEPDRRKPKEGLDYILIARNNEPARRFKLDRQTPFNEDDWRQERGLAA